MPVSPRIAQERETRHNARIKAAEAVIPQGPYCYTIDANRETPGTNGAIPITLCRHWKRRTDWPRQGDGYCRLLKCGDSTPGRDAEGRPRATFLLWDQVKECGINDTDPADDAGH